MTEEKNPHVLENGNEEVFGYAEFNPELNITAKNEPQKREKKKIVRSKPNEPVLRVAADTPPKRLSKTIMGCLKDWGTCRVLSVGASSSWQAYKAIVLVKKELSGIGIHIYIDPSFMDPRPVIDGIEQTGADVTIKMTKEAI